MKKIITLCLIGILLINCTACSTDKSGMDRLPSIMEESKESVTIQFDGEESIKYICNYADKLYFTLYYDNAIYVMEIEDNQSRMLPINVPRDYEAGVIATDVNGNLYTVFSKKDESGRYVSILLMKMNDKYELVYQSEIIDYVDKNSVPWAMAADKDGYVYIRMGNYGGNNLFCVVDSEGNYSGTIEGGKEYWIIDAMGRCADGYVYAVLEAREGQDNERYIARLEGKKASLSIQDVGPILVEGYVCSGIGSGFTEDFLIYASSFDNVIGYSYGKDTYSEAGEITPEIKSMASGARSVFLDDGRMLLVTRRGQLENDEIVMLPGNTMFYIPMK